MWYLKKASCTAFNLIKSQLNISHLFSSKMLFWWPWDSDALLGFEEILQQW